ncbi:hypothetical protein CTA1_6887 [Colletotrichum tanaceti]|uniref:Uncharacterized protein n=1 Tax=Colletotrichum tanaceti TaxID=1306861 RepID=A0A4U6XM84_9PEZI|nr:hypothetical protein CTA1_6887 [Colletotrichum tanaceti]
MMRFISRKGEYAHYKGFVRWTRYDGSSGFCWADCHQRLGKREGGGVGSSGRLATRMRYSFESTLYGSVVVWVVYGCTE